jgi:hypothetical protein
MDYWENGSDDESGCLGDAGGLREDQTLAPKAITLTANASPNKTNCRLIMD